MARIIDNIYRENWLYSTCFTISFHATRE